MFEKIKEHYREQGRQQQLAVMIEKFSELHDQYYQQGDEAAQNLVIDLVAYIQEDYDAISDRF